ncbi:MAG: DNA gyrase subunit A [Deltaproteobacteria bacterium]|nr:DNA gyrase subunit A [Deltaproteobacteria bacterium]
MELLQKIDINIEDELKKSYMDYAMSVIIGRAIPDIRDGLKPVHRRVLFAMHELKNEWNKPYKKSARVVGDTIGKYHPHGDTAVYDTLVRLAQDFSMRYPLVDGQGNFGSIDGDPPAAMRYTEVRMSRITHEFLNDLEKDTVEFNPTYDGSMFEPEVMPARVPNLLVNGSSGIAVGMATNVPPHNLGEVIDGLVALIDNPGITIAELMEYIPGPDFPTYAYIYGRSGIYDAYSTGRGIIKLRAKVEVENTGGRDMIIINELPYQVNKARLIEKIVELVKEKKIEGIFGIRDESDRHGMRVVIELKKEAVAEVITNQLYAYTAMQVTFGIIFLAIVNRKPEVLNLRQILDLFINHRQDVVIRRTKFDLRKAEERAHILEGFAIALSHLDEVIRIIRAAPAPKEAKTALISAFSLSEIQAQAILDLRLSRLTALESNKILEELAQVKKDIDWLRKILSSGEIVLDIIKGELQEIRDNYADVRRTEIIGVSEDITIEDMIAEEDMVVTITHTGYIKRNQITLYRSQKRGGKGVTGVETKEEDFVEWLYVASTHDYLLIFTNMGRVHWLKVYEIPKAGRTSRGKAIVNLLKLQPEEKVAAILKINEFKSDHFVVMATKNGYVKKTDLMSFSRPRPGGLTALIIGEDDELIAAGLTDGQTDIFLGTREGMSIRFTEDDIRPTGRAARGVTGIDLKDDDRVVGMAVLRSDATILTVTARGFGKRTGKDEYRLQRRGGRGLITVRITDKNGPVIGVRQVTPDDDLMIITETGRIIRMNVGSISVIGRVTQGVKLMDMDQETGEKVASITTCSMAEEPPEEEPSPELVDVDPELE